MSLATSVVIWLHSLRLFSQCSVFQHFNQVEKGHVTQRHHQKRNLGCIFYAASIHFNGEARFWCTPKMQQAGRSGHAVDPHLTSVRSAIGFNLNAFFFCFLLMQIRKKNWSVRKLYILRIQQILRNDPTHKKKFMRSPQFWYDSSSLVWIFRESPTQKSRKKVWGVPQKSTPAPNSSLQPGCPEKGGGWVCVSPLLNHTWPHTLNMGGVLFLDEPSGKAPCPHGPVVV